MIFFVRRNRSSFIGKKTMTLIMFSHFVAYSVPLWQQRGKLQENVKNSRLNMWARNNSGILFFSPSVSFHCVSLTQEFIFQVLGSFEVNTPFGDWDWAVLSLSFCWGSESLPSFSFCTSEWLLLSAVCSSGTPKMEQKSNTYYQHAILKYSFISYSNPLEKWHHLFLSFAFFSSHLERLINSLIGSLLQLFFLHAVAYWKTKRDENDAIVPQYQPPPSSNTKALFISK